MSFSLENMFCEYHPTRGYVKRSLGEIMLRLDDCAVTRLAKLMIEKKLIDAQEFLDVLGVSGVEVLDAFGRTPDERAISGDDCDEEDI